MSLPYRILLGCLLLGASIFSLGPWWTMQSINRAVQEKNTGQWPELVKQSDLQDLAGKMLAGMLDLKMYAEIEKNPSEALRDNLAGKELIPKTAQILSGPVGIGHLLCGDLRSDPASAIAVNGCGVLDGELSWESPTRVRVTFTNLDMHWQTSLILARVGLLQWQAVDIDLPVDAILERFAGSVGLKPKSGI